MRWFLAFSTPGVEDGFARKRNMQLLRQDATFAFMWLLFGAAGISKLPQFEAAERQRFPWSEVAILAVWSAWMPLLLLLIRFRTDWYVRHRALVMCALRLCRTFMVMNSRLPWREAKYVGSYNTVPATPWQSYLHLYWKANLLFFGAVTFILPLRLTIPLQLLSLLVTLVFTAQRCRLECGHDAGTLAWPLTAAAWPGQCDATAAAAAAWQPAGAADACLAAADPLLAQQYYGGAARWLSRLLPRSLAAAGSRLAGGAEAGGACLPLCFSVHAWFQAVGGVLVPLALLWALEERLRCREVADLRLQRSLQQQQRQLEGTAGGDVPPPLPPPAQPCRRPQPLAAAVLAAWLACSAWMLWAVLNLLLL